MSGERIDPVVEPEIIDREEYPGPKRSVAPRIRICTKSILIQAPPSPSKRIHQRALDEDSSVQALGVAALVAQHGRRA